MRMREMNKWEFTWLSLLYKFTWFFIYFLILSDGGPMLETLDYTIRIGSTSTILYFDLYLYSAYAAHTTFISFRSQYTGMSRVTGPGCVYFIQK